MFMQNTPITTVRTSRPLTEIEFCAWVAQAVPGDRLEYHRGFLVLDTFPAISHLPDAQRVELARLGSRAFWAAENGLVHLVQEREGPDRFAYIAIARPKPKAATASLSALLLDAQAA
ncbi:hypothetical protein [Roseovarius sp. D22-M7]|uniref:hypothetical protein n=1 Tax=Roseovarius sp. D22-M7 TaxID=3127116 RepID=UPI003010478B